MSRTTFLADRVTPATDYTTVTEVPGGRASREQLAMLQTRYAYAAGFCEGRAVLEVACGAGLGLGVLARRARRVVGGDCTEALLGRARRHYGRRLPLVRLDAHALPFRAGSFDVVLLFEAIYYLAQPSGALAECRRVLRPGGVLLLCTTNREWADFNPSPFSTRYFSGPELVDVLADHGFSSELHAAFPATTGSTRERLASWLKRRAVAHGLMPRTMKGKAMFKRIFFGELVTLPAELTDGGGGYPTPRPLPPGAAATGYKVLYVVARAR